MDKKLLGRWGEQAAANYLKSKRYKIIGMNYACRMGEIDLIAEKGGYIVFAEVKLRKSNVFAEACEYVTRSKQEKIKTTASLWLSQNDIGLQPRFDVIEVYAPEGVSTSSAIINHIENAFE